ncbi:MaoC family dehydratase [Spongiactinospora sp. TRM90649]|uniref:MaoC family dehydratase n=1 Tax=Spongiactinospora sp. TRM90649 TaxID=3031114 RepID=UPI0023F8FFD6|nr:MaoC family dehydratase [Spongiactinospora sp. TRM90649]MDF5755120.1 MaoC family dehydratase [Spongiactinospora sp. TRM90649]
MTTTVTVSELPGLVGRDLGHSPYLTIDQKRIDLFADATDDHQWIHVDPVAAASGPFGTTIAHGYLTLALVIPLWSDLLDVEDATTKVNYGLDKVRFPAPVPAGARIRLHAQVAEVTEIDGGAQLVLNVTLSAEGADKPVCVAHPVFRYYH